MPLYANMCPWTRVENNGDKEFVKSILAMRQQIEEKKVTVNSEFNVNKHSTKYSIIWKLCEICREKGAKRFQPNQVVERTGSSDVYKNDAYKNWVSTVSPHRVAGNMWNGWVQIEVKIDKNKSIYWPTLNYVEIHVKKKSHTVCGKMCSVNGRASNLAFGMFAHKGTHRMAKFKHHRARNSNRMMAIWNVLLICYFIEIANNVALSIIAQSIEDNMGNKIRSDHLACIWMVLLLLLLSYPFDYHRAQSQSLTRLHLHTHMFYASLAHSFAYLSVAWVLSTRPIHAG